MRPHEIFSAGLILYELVVVKSAYVRWLTKDFDAGIAYGISLRYSLDFWIWRAIVRYQYLDVLKCLARHGCEQVI
jgi:hypothetical protein